MADNDMPDMLLGSNVQPSIIEMSGEQVQLGTVVRAAVERGGFTAAEWNALPDNEREKRIASARKYLECIFAEPTGIMAGNPNGPMGEVVRAELERQMTDNDKDVVRLQRYRKKPVVIAASQWFKNGDHPLDYSKDHDSIEEGDLGVLTAEKRKARNYEGDIVRYFRRPDVDGKRGCRHCAHTMHEHGWIDTKEGGHVVCPGDWIITGVQGEHYPCKPDIFAATYEPADAPHPAAMSKREAALVEAARLANELLDKISSGSAGRDWEPLFHQTTEWMKAAHRVGFDLDEALAAYSTPSIEAAEGSGWRPISEAPRGRKLIVGWKNPLGNWRSVMATYYLPKTLDADESCEEQDDDGYAPEGWYEESETHDNLLPLNGKQTPTHFRPLPAPPSPEKE